MFAVAVIAVQRARTRRGRRRGNNIVIFLIISALGLATVKFNRLSAIDYLSSEQAHPSRKSLDYERRWSKYIKRCAPCKQPVQWRSDEI